MWQDLVSALRSDMERRRDMGMRLDTEHLEMLTDKLVKLESTGVEVTQFKMLDHTIFLTWEKEGSEMPKPIVVGISRDQKVGSGGIGGLGGLVTRNPGLPGSPQVPGGIGTQRGR